MQYIAELGSGQEMRFYYSSKVYDPHYSSIDTAILANAFIFGNIRYLDIATGCGITGLILKRLHPGMDVTLTDIDPEALRVARLNAKRLGLPVIIKEADLIPQDKLDYHVITANLPTFDEEQMKKETLHGPKQAYAGGVTGMDLYTRLFKEAIGRCVVLVCECQRKHQQSFIAIAALNGWKVVAQSGDSFALNREDIAKL